MSYTALQKKMNDEWASDNKLNMHIARHKMSWNAWFAKQMVTVIYIFHIQLCVVGWAILSIY